MDILSALRQEEGKLQQQLKGIQVAIDALNGSHPASSGGKTITQGPIRKRRMSAAARARISKATKARWAKFRADRAKRAK